MHLIPRLNWADELLPSDCSLICMYMYPPLKTYCFPFYRKSKCIEPRSNKIITCSNEFSGDLLSTKISYHYMYHLLLQFYYRWIFFFSNRVYNHGYMGNTLTHKMFNKRFLLELSAFCTILRLFIFSRCCNKKIHHHLLGNSIFFFLKKIEKKNKHPSQNFCHFIF